MAGGIELIRSEPQIPLAGDIDKNRTFDALVLERLDASRLSSDVVAGSYYDPACDLNDDREINPANFAILPHFLLQKN